MRYLYTILTTIVVVLIIFGTGCQTYRKNDYHVPENTVTGNGTSETIGKNCVTNIVCYSNPSVLLYEDIIKTKAAVDLIKNNGHRGFLTEDHTKFNLYKSDISDIYEGKGENIDYLILKLFVKDMVSMSYVTESSCYSNGETITNSYRSGMTWINAEVTGVIDVLEGKEGYKFEAESLVGHDIILKRDSFWYKDDTGIIFRRCYGTNSENGFFYIPKVGEEIIAPVFFSENKKSQGFASFKPEYIVEICREQKIKLNEIIESKDNHNAAELIEKVDFYDSKNGFPVLCFFDFYPANDLRNNKIVNRNDFTEYLYSLDLYYQNISNLSLPWCNGYYGCTTPPEINDVLRNISIGFE